MSILSDLSELVNARVITSETAAEISGYYKNKQENSPIGKTNFYPHDPY